MLPLVIAFIATVVFAAISLRRSLLVEIEEGTTGILSSWGEIIGRARSGAQDHLATVAQG